MSRVVIFLILSIPLILFSWKVFFNVRSHGLYRFLTWECILWVLISNVPYWFIQPIQFHQIISWIFLYITARLEELENIAYFGQDYIEYKKRSSMFIPYVF